MTTDPSQLDVNQLIHYKNDVTRNDKPSNC